MSVKILAVYISPLLDFYSLSRGNKQTKNTDSKGSQTQARVVAQLTEYLHSIHEVLGLISELNWAWWYTTVVPAMGK